MSYKKPQDNPKMYLPNEYKSYINSDLVIFAYQGDFESVKNETVKQKHNLKCLEAGLIIAVEKGYSEIVSFLLNGGISPNLRNRPQQTLLYRAAFFGYDKIVNSLLKAGADPRIEIEMESLCFPSPYLSPSYAVTISIERNHFEVYKVMMKYMYINKQLDQTLVSKIVYLLANHGYPNEILRILKSDLSIDPKNKFIISALHKALDDTYLDVAEIMISKGVLFDGSFGTLSGTPLKKALENANIPTLKFLIEKGVSLKCSELNGITPLVLAVKFGSIEIVKMLIDAKVELSIPFISKVFKHPDFDIYETALSFAIRKGYKEIAKILIDVGAELPPPPKSKKLSNKSPFQFANSDSGNSEDNFF